MIQRLARLAVCMTLLLASPFGASRPSAADPVPRRAGVTQTPAERYAAAEQARSELLTMLGVDPWAEDDEWLQDRGLWQRLIAKLAALHQCAEQREGTPPEPARSWESLSPAEQAEALATAPWPENPEELLRGREFWERLRQALREWNYRCGAPTETETLNNFFACRDLCEINYTACYNRCAEPGPPAPSCLSSCDWRALICDALCLM